ncbi:MAG: cation diffusion facilitator family transporter [Tissierellia bacterium]|nr:cation diffusion facilitator family transporter [Tissierellia bacterium]
MNENFIKIATGEKNPDFEDLEIRAKIGYFSSISGIILNLILVIIKFIIGTVTGSIAVVADAFNNISDTASAIITFVGLKLSNKPADKEHPFGHGRIEYIAGLVVSVFVLLLGFELLKTSVKTLLNPKQIEFSIISIILLLFTILIKVYMYRVYIEFSKKINSMPLKATALDALGDVFTTAIVVCGIVLSRFTKIPIDAIVGIIVSVLIIKTGIELILETISPIIGDAPDKNLAKDIEKIVLKQPNLSGFHDLLIHSYGPGRKIASVNVEMPGRMTLREIHEQIDKAELEVFNLLGVKLVIHVDPIGVMTEREIEVRKTLHEILKSLPGGFKIYDFYIMKNRGSELLRFDMIFDASYAGKIERMNEIADEVKIHLNDAYPELEIEMHLDFEYQ